MKRPTLAPMPEDARQRLVGRLLDLWAASAPPAVCACGHTGNGRNGQHGTVGWPGHGPCKKCGCRRFSFARWTDGFVRFLTAHGAVRS